MKSLLTALLSMFVVVSGRAQTPVVRATLSPEKGIIVGQPVHLAVTVLVPNYFTGSVDLPEFEIENAIVVLPQDRPQHSNEKIGGIAYAGITQTYTIYPQQPGDFRLPPATLTVPYASAPPQSSTANLALPVLSFHADIPAAAAGLDYFLPTTQLTMQQKWSQPLKDLRAGDSVERTITITATKMQAMLIPALPLEAPDGLRVYSEEPSVQDQKTDRGEFVFGRRIQTAKYFIQKEGDYALPAIELKWWNLSTSRLVTAALPAVHFTAAANPNYVAELPPEPDAVPAAETKHISAWTKYKFWIRIVAPWCLLLIILVWIAWRYVPRVVRSLQAKRRERERSELAYFRHLQNSCNHNDPMQAYRQFLRWLALAHPDATVDQFLKELSDPGLRSETEGLGAHLFAAVDGHPWNGSRLARLLKQHRSARVDSSAKPHQLTKLNP